MLKRFPNDVVILKLYALRRGLCFMIDEKTIDLNTAVDIFELERETLVQQQKVKQSNRYDGVL